MPSQSLNLVLRFLLELIAFASVGYWAYQLSEQWYRYLFAIVCPLVLAVLWGVFAVPNDPSRSGNTVIATPGTIRLFLELFIFGVGVFCLFDMEERGLALIFGVLVIVHYVVSHKRIAWLLKQ